MIVPDVENVCTDYYREADFFDLTYAIAGTTYAQHLGLTYMLRLHKIHIDHPLVLGFDFAAVSAVKTVFH